MSTVRRGRRSACVVATLALALGMSGCTSGSVDLGSGPATPRPTVTSSPIAPTPTVSPTATPPTPTATPAPTTTPTPTPTLPPAPAPTSAPAPDPEPALLRVGDQGEAVAQVQRRLQELSYFLPTVDGTFGSGTQQAVWALQKAAGLDRDGVVGPATRAALVAGVRPQPRSTAGRALEVDLDEQLVLAVQDGQVVATINASSGSGARYQALGRDHTAYTPTGDFTVVREINGMHDSTLELGQMYRPKYFRGGWAIHGSPSVPPWPASHGCVRVSNDAISWIWDQFGAPLGTPILVYGG